MLIHYWPELLCISIAVGAFAVYVVRFSDVSMRLWQDFLDSLNTDGGHILILGMFVLLCCLHVAATSDLQKYQGELVGALLLMLKTAGSNKTRRDRPTDPEKPSETKETP